MTHDVERSSLRTAPPAALVLLLVFGSLALPEAVQAQEGTSQYLQLQDVYRTVLRDNPQLLASRAQVRAALARAASAGTPPDPEVQIGAMNYSAATWGPMAPLGMFQLQVMQMLPLAGKLRLQKDGARQKAAAIELRADELAWKLRAEAAEVYLDLHSLEERLRILRESVRLLEDIAAAAAAMYEVGEGRQADVLRAQVELSRLQEDTLAMRAMRQAAVARLNVLLNRPPRSPLAPTAPVELPTELPSLEQLLERTSLERPAIRASQREVQAAAANLALARRSLWPDLQVGVQYGQRSMDGRPERMLSLMVGASLPLHAGRRQLREREEAAAMVAMARAEVDALRAETLAEVAEAYAHIEHNRHLWVLYSSTILPQADANLASALASYRVGLVDFMTVLDASQALLRFREEVVAVRTEEAKYWARMEALLGAPLLAQRNGAADYKGGLP
jgi:cobalt-zinc-cadmium efflux system outer membrane protein